MKRSEIAARLQRMIDPTTAMQVRIEPSGAELFGIPVERYAEALGVEVEPDEPALPPTGARYRRPVVSHGGLGGWFGSQVADHPDGPWRDEQAARPTVEVTLGTKDAVEAIEGFQAKYAAAFPPPALTLERVGELRGEATGESGNHPHVECSTAELVELCNAWLRERECSRENVFVPVRRVEILHERDDRGMRRTCKISIPDGEAWKVESKEVTYNGKTVEAK